MNEQVEEEAKERHWQQIVFPRVGSLEPMEAETSEEQVERTDGDRGSGERRLEVGDGWQDEGRAKQRRY